jgi:hypothetical protein
MFFRFKVDRRAVATQGFWAVRADVSANPFSSAPDAVEGGSQFAVVDVSPFLDRIGALGLSGAGKLDVVKVFAVQGDFNVTALLTVRGLAYDSVLRNDAVFDGEAVLHVEATTDHGSDLLENGVGNLSVLLWGVHLQTLRLLAGIFRQLVLLL